MAESCLLVIVSQDGRTALTIACLSGYRDVALALVKKGENLAQADNVSSLPPSCHCHPIMNSYARTHARTPLLAPSILLMDSVHEFMMMMMMMMMMMWPTLDWAGRMAGLRC